MSDENADATATARSRLGRSAAARATGGLPPTFSGARAEENQVRAGAAGSPPRAAVVQTVPGSPGEQSQTSDYLPGGSLGSEGGTNVDESERGSETASAAGESQRDASLNAALAAFAQVPTPEEQAAYEAGQAARAREAEAAVGWATGSLSTDAGLAAISGGVFAKVQERAEAARAEAAGGAAGGQAIQFLNAYQILQQGLENPLYQKALYTYILCWILDGLGHDMIYGNSPNLSALLAVFLQAHPELQDTYKAELKRIILPGKGDASAKAVIVNALKDLATSMGLDLSTSRPFSYNAAGGDALVALLGQVPGVLSVDSLKGDYKDMLVRASNSIQLYFAKSAAVAGDPASFNPSTSSGEINTKGGTIPVVTQAVAHIVNGAASMPMSRQTDMAFSNVESGEVTKTIQLSDTKRITATFTNKGVSITQMQKLNRFLLGLPEPAFQMEGPNTIVSATATNPLRIQFTPDRAAFTQYEQIAACVGLKTDGDFGIGRIMSDLAAPTYTRGGGQPNLTPGNYVDIHLTIDNIAYEFGRVFCSKISCKLNSNNFELYKGSSVRSETTRENINALLGVIRSKFQVGGTFQSTRTFVTGGIPEHIDCTILALYNHVGNIENARTPEEEVEGLLQQIRDPTILRVYEPSPEDPPGKVEIYRKVADEFTEVSRRLDAAADKKVEARAILAKEGLEARLTSIRRVCDDYTGTRRYRLTNVGEQRRADGMEYARGIIQVRTRAIERVGERANVIVNLLIKYHLKLAELSATYNLMYSERFVDPIKMLSAESLPGLTTLYTVPNRYEDELCNVDTTLLDSQLLAVQAISRNLEGGHADKNLMKLLTKLFIQLGFPPRISSIVAGNLTAQFTSTHRQNREKVDEVNFVDEVSDEEPIAEQNVAAFITGRTSKLAELGNDEDAVNEEYEKLNLTYLTDEKFTELVRQMENAASNAGYAAASEGESEEGVGAAGGSAAAGGEGAGGAPGGGAAGGSAVAQARRTSTRFTPNYPVKLPRQVVIPFRENAGGGISDPKLISVERGVALYYYQDQFWNIVTNDNMIYEATPVQGGGSGSRNRKYRNKKTHKKVKKSSRPSKKQKKSKKKST
jgi:hypothetical protein